MKKQDFRNISDATLEEYRKTAIRLITGGRPKGEVAEIIGCSTRTITNWWSAYKASGSQGLRSKQRGRKEGEKRRLTQAQEKGIQRMIRDKYPDQLKLPYALWTTRAVQELIGIHYGMFIPIRTVGDYLKRWGFTPQKPIRRAYEQQPKQVQQWLTEQYPAIRARAKKGECPSAVVRCDGLLQCR